MMTIYQLRLGTISLVHPRAEFFTRWTDSPLPSDVYISIITIVCLYMIIPIIFINLICYIISYIETCTRQLYDCMRNGGSTNPLI